MRRRWWIAGAVAEVLIATAVHQMWPENKDVWNEGSTHSGWRVVFDGYGGVRGSASGDRIELRPNETTSASTTHGALVASSDTHADVTFTVDVQTNEQLRRPTPNPWEVGWLLWSYTDPEHFYALVLKPNGWEVSKQDTAYEGSQRFLASGQERTFPVGTTHTATVALTPAPGALTMDVTVDGEHLATVTDEHSPYTTGTVALYCEDATVTFTGVGAATTAPTTP